MTEVAARRMPMTVSDYLAFADAHPRQRFELLSGTAVATVPGTLRHSLIAGNINSVLRRQARDRGCQSLADAGVSMGEDAEFFAQPDVMVRCGPMDGRRRWASDPLVIVEVLSPSTMADDRGDKLQCYLRDFPSLRHVALVDQDECRIEDWGRADEGSWPEDGAQVPRPPEAVLDLAAIGASLPLAEAYEDVTFD
ncbi:MAG: Uma2 family endonuclease [Alsobacter sp.]